MFKVKICGITNLKEIEFLNKLKVDYAGFVFAEGSKRKVNIQDTKKFRESLNSSIKSVGVFKDNKLSEVQKVYENTGIDIIQLHGSEDKEYIKNLRKLLENRPLIWKALSIKDEDKLHEYLCNDYSDLIDMYLIDGANPGSGEEYSLERLKEIILKSNCKMPFMLAGGIRPENALKKAMYINPYGIDVSSGVEDIMSDGIRQKSFLKIEKLMNNLKI